MAPRHWLHYWEAHSQALPDELRQTILVQKMRRSAGLAPGRAWRVRTCTLRLHAQKQTPLCFMDSS